jgi:hypothetical protein
MRKYVLVLLTGALVFSSCPTTDSGGADISEARIVRSGIPGDFMGMVHAGNRAEVVEEYALLDELGVEWMLKDFSWSSVQPSKTSPLNPAVFDSYVQNGKNNGKKILALLDYDVSWLHDGTYGDDPYNNYDTDPDNNTDIPYISPGERPQFIAYVKATVLHFSTTVDAWCIWNEPNLSGRFWCGTRAEFFELTKQTAAAIREVAPEVIIIGGAFASTATEDWVRGIFTSGAMDDIDAIAYHPYMPSPGPTVNNYNNFKRIVSEYGFGDKIWVTEVGYPVDGTLPTRVDKAIMPGTLLETIVLLTANGPERIFWYELFDHGDTPSSDSEHWFGMVYGDGLIGGEFQKRPWAAAYQLAAQHIPGTTCIIPQRRGLPDYIQTYQFTGSGGRNALVVWNEITSISRNVEVYLPGVNQKVYNLDTGAATSIGETSNYTLKSKDGVNHFIQFFTWKTTTSSQYPRVSRN